MENRNVALITSAFGHGFMELNFAKAHNVKAVAFSEKETKEEFEKEVNDIYSKLSPFYPKMKKAKWEDMTTLKEQGVSYRQILLDKQVTDDLWDKFARTTLPPKMQKNLPSFKSLKRSSNNILLVPQKLVSDGKCGLSADQQTVPVEAFNFFKYENGNNYVLGQHFHKQNDIENVKAIAKDFNMYVPGEKEDKHVLGLRGVNHDQYFNMYKKLGMAVGIAGTHTWYMLTCFPDTPQIILYNKNLTEDWQAIAKAYQKQGKHIYAIGFDENTNWKKFALQVKATYHKVSRTINKEKSFLNKINHNKQQSVVKG